MYILIEKATEYCKTYIFETENGAHHKLNLLIEHHTGMNTGNLSFVGDRWLGYDKNSDEITLLIRRCEEGTIDKKIRHQNELLKKIVQPISENELINLGFTREDLLHYKEL